MTPEDDVNKDPDNSDAEAPENGDKAPDSEATADNAEKAAPDQATDSENAVDATVNADDSTGDAAGQATDNASDEDAVEDKAAEDDTAEDDIDRAASAQSHAEAAIAKAMKNDDADDDPLGFGDQRMEGETAGDDELSVLQAQLEASEAKVANHADQLLRLQAEMENQRKRAQNDVTKAHKFALEKIALDLLPVKDSLEMGLQASTGEDAEPMKIIEGSELTLKMLAQALEKYNIVEINPVDEKFDPEFHQAMSMQPVEGKEPNTVASVLQKGYTLNDRLIRPALVMVAK